jgi:hypothetical protein
MLGDLASLSQWDDLSTRVPRNLLRLSVTRTPLGRQDRHRDDGDDDGEGAANSHRIDHPLRTNPSTHQHPGHGDGDPTPALNHRKSHVQASVALRRPG